MATAPQPGPSAAALITGRVQLNNDGCIQIGSTKTLWPFGYSFRKSGAQVQLLDENQKIVGRVGEDIAVGGGSGRYPHTPPYAADQRCLADASMIIFAGRIAAK